MSSEGDSTRPSPIVRRVRPTFADDVYGVEDASKRQQQANEEVFNDTEMCESALAQRRSAQLPKLKEIANRTRAESADYPARFEMADLDFVYTDCDTHAAELAELYTYSEIDDWALNVHAFRNYADSKRIDQVWSQLTDLQQKSIFHDLMERMESVQSDVRLEAARIVLYLLQGAYLDFVDEESVSIGNGFQTSPSREGVDVGTGGYEEACLVQGIFNAYKAYEVGLYQALCTMLMVEIDDPWDVSCPGEPRSSRSSSVSNSRSASNVDLSDSVEKRHRKSATMADNEALRVVLSSIYHMVESIRRKDLFEMVIPQEKKEAFAVLRNCFIAEIEQPIDNVGQSLIMVLLEMMPAFCHGSTPHFPMKKVLLLVWKVLLTILGGWKELREAKAAKRTAAGLDQVEDTLVVASVMKASIINGTDMEQATGAVRPRRSAHPSARLIGRQLACASTDDSIKDDFDDTDLAGGRVESATPRRRDGDSDAEEGEYELSEDVSPDVPLEDDVIEELADETLKNEAKKDAVPPDPGTPAPSLKPSRRPNPLLSISSSGERTPIAGTPPPMEILFRSSLPWKPKVREEDIEAFLQHERMKFFGYRLPSDSTTVFGLPPPILKSVEALRRHLYISLNDTQAAREKVLNRYLFSQREGEDDASATEKLYRMMLPNLSQYVIALLKVLLAAAPSSKAKSDAINILSDVLTPETDNNEVLSNSINFDSSLTNVLEQSVRIAIDVNRHKEIMVKAASSILILLMKHLRLNHVYQFEYLSQHLVFANCIPLILKFLDQNMVRYVQSKHELLPFNYPRAPLHYVRNHDEWPVLNVDNVDEGDSQSQSYYLWRNVFSTINLLRVLNKLTKWKHSRTMMLVVFKSAPILKRSLRVRLAVFQLYVLKLLKVQARYLGRQWRRSNMEIMSAIYSKVRHRLNDDWAYANETRSKSWDFQSEEAALKTAVERFNSRRYSHLYPAFALEPSEAPSPGDTYLDTVDLREFEPVDNSVQSLLGAPKELSERFKRNYERWVDHEVMKRQTNWDQLLINTRGIMDMV
uniref:Protein FAM40B n=1 Tax=Ascaris suum TaxID=6253 RepID=F1KTD6_ASCSU